MGNVWSQRSDNTPVHRPPPKTAKPKRADFEDLPFQFWTVDDTLTWLKTTFVDDVDTREIIAIINLIVEYQIDGEGLVILGKNFFEEKVLDSPQTTLFYSKIESFNKLYTNSITSSIEDHKKQRREQWIDQQKEQNSQFDVTSLNSTLVFTPNDFFPERDLQNENLSSLIQFYHNETKHNSSSDGARSLKADWSLQPNSYRRYYGAPYIKFSTNTSLPTITFPKLYKSQAPNPITQNSLADFLYHSLALSGRKQSLVSSWTLRVNPSSGGLHPTELYIITNNLNSNNLEKKFEIKSSNLNIFHYSSKEHGLELIRSLKTTEIQNTFLNSFHKLIIDSKLFLLIGNTLIWRECWKYGERGLRYSNLDMGHVLASLAFGASLQGWKLKMINIQNRNELSQILGLNCDVWNDRSYVEYEYPLVLLVCYLPEFEFEIEKLFFEKNFVFFDKNENENNNFKIFGFPNRLSWDYDDWDLVYLVNKNCEILNEKKNENNNYFEKIEKKNFNKFKIPIKWNKNILVKYKEQDARKIIRQRRSALGFKNHKIMKTEQFFLILSKLIPSYNSFPYSMLSDGIFKIMKKGFLGIFVLRVENLKSGLYILFLDDCVERIDKMKKTIGQNENFLWSQECMDGYLPEHFPLYLVKEMDLTELGTLASTANCQQNIASDGFFSLGMFMKFDSELYREIHWGCGLMGGILYLESEALEARGTGMGCFLDEEMGSAFGVAASSGYQNFYSFAVGYPIKDPRLMLF